MVKSLLGGLRTTVRYFNASAKVPLTTEQIAAGLEKNRKWRKFNDQSSKYLFACCLLWRSIILHILDVYVFLFIY